MTESTLVFTNGDKSTGQPITSTWVSASGITITVVTYKASASQSQADWQAAHVRYYDEMWAVFPPGG